MSRLETALAECLSASIKFHAQDAVSSLVTLWPEDKPFGVEIFGTAARALTFVRAVFEREQTALSSRGISLENSEVIRALRLRLRRAVKSQSDGAKELEQLLGNFSLKVICELVANEMSIKPTRAVVKTVEGKHPYGESNMYYFVKRKFGVDRDYSKVACKSSNGYRNGYIIYLVFSLNDR